MAKNTKSQRSRPEGKPVEKATGRSGWRTQLEKAKQDPAVQLQVAKHRKDMAEQTLARQVAYRDISQASIDQLTAEIAALEASQKS